jgi:CHAD domain-containing protein
VRLAATVAVGVGVVLARAERDRRVARAGRARERQFSLLVGEPRGAGLRRMALGQLDLAIEMLGDDGASESPQHAVHETRKALKRLRALIRLLRERLGEQSFARENALLREAGRRLARARDAEVMVAALDDLLARQPRKLAQRRGVRKLRARLEDDRRRAAAQMRADSAMRAQVLGDLRLLRGRVLQWSLTDEQGIAIEPALERLYRQGRRRMARAERGSGDHTRSMHRWRKRVKDLRYVAELLNRAEADERGDAHKRRKQGKRIRRRARGGKKLRGESKYLGEVARRADQLGELLGEEHDLAVLAERVRAETSDRAAGKPIGRRTRRRLLRLIARRRKLLRRRALGKGERLYRRSPKRFARRARRTTGP